MGAAYGVRTVIQHFNTVQVVSQQSLGIINIHAGYTVCGITVVDQTAYQAAPHIAAADECDPDIFHSVFCPGCMPVVLSLIAV